MTVDRWGVSDGYHDLHGQWHATPSTSVAAVRAALGVPPDGSGEQVDADTIMVLRAGDPMTIDRPAQLHTEDGRTIALSGLGPLPSDVGLGYHRLVDAQSGASRPLIIVPPTVYRPDNLRSWGWAVQLYALRSRNSWGIGDLGDLQMLGKWSAAHGAGITLISPLHAAIPGVPQQNSPYFPSSRVFRNPMHLCIEDVPGFGALAAEFAETSAAGRSLNNDRRIDRDAVYQLKQMALEALWRQSAHAGATAPFRVWALGEGPLVWSYATFCVLSERFGRPWTQWPVEYRHPDNDAVVRLREVAKDRVEFHVWQQWLLDQQLQATASVLPLVLDLAVGVDRSGADAWLWQDLFAFDLNVGAPPDDLGESGQDWGLLPFHPLRLRAAGYEPFVRTVRAAFRHAGGIRIDHVMGLFRLYLVPHGASPTQGCYVYLRFWEMLGIVALESHRAKAWVLGEDLGIVEDYVSKELVGRKILSYKVMLFESSPAAELAADALGAVTTHDLPTVAGLWTGSDEAAQKEIGLPASADNITRMRASLAMQAGVALDASVDDLVDGVHTALAAAPCVVVTATIEDALRVRERPNMPGTIDEWPNWRIALPEPLDDILSRGALNATAAIFTDRAQPA